MKTPLKMQEKMGNSWVLVSRNVWPPHTPSKKDPLNSGNLLTGGSAAPHPRRLLPQPNAPEPHAVAEHHHHAPTPQHRRLHGVSVAGQRRGSRRTPRAALVGRRALVQRLARAVQARQQRQQVAVPPPHLRQEEEEWSYQSD
jgi:hypothetical protein